MLAIRDDAVKRSSSQQIVGKGERRHEEESEEEAEVVVNFSLQNLMKFKGDSLIHTADLVPFNKKSIRARPNYDNRKRRRFMNQPPERKEQLGFATELFSCSVWCGI